MSKNRSNKHEYEATRTTRRKDKASRRDEGGGHQISQQNQLGAAEYRIRTPFSITITTFKIQQITTHHIISPHYMHTRICTGLDQRRGKDSARTHIYSLQGGVHGTLVGLTKRKERELGGRARVGGNPNVSWRVSTLGYGYWGGRLPRGEQGCGASGSGLQRAKGHCPPT